MEQLLDTLINIDSRVFLFFNGIHAPFWDWFMYMFSGRFIWVPMYAAVLYMLYRNYSWKTATIYLVAIALTITIADQSCATYIRPYVERLRPSNLDNRLSILTHVVNGYRGGSYGFPSCHAANSFAFAAFAGLMVKRRWFTLFVFGWAVVNCYTRVYLGVHYPGDLLVGALIGMAVGSVVYCCARALAKVMANPDGRFGYRRWPMGGMSLTFRDTSVVMIVGWMTVAYIAAVSLVRLWV